MARITNPMFRGMDSRDNAVVLDGEPMSVNGAVNKSLILFMLLLMSSICTWTMYFQGAFDKLSTISIAGFIVSLIAFFVCMFSSTFIKIAAPVYAIGEGLVLGGISAELEKIYPGIAIQAVAGTFLALFSLLFLYKIKAIQCSERFRSVIIIATISIFGIYMVDLLGNFFGLSIPGIFSNGLIGIGFSLLVCVVAALNLIIDFNNIEVCANNMMPKFLEWRCAVGLMVTLVWLYMEILNLLAKLNSRN